MVPEAADTPEDLEQLRRRFEEFRNTQPTRETVTVTKAFASALQQTESTSARAVSLPTSAEFDGRQPRVGIVPPPFEPTRYDQRGQMTSRSYVPAENYTRSSKDPLANVRERQRKRSGFDYRPESADPKELIRES
jgi:hypothetical protein